MRCKAAAAALLVKVVFHQVDGDENGRKKKKNYADFFIQ